MVTVVAQAKLFGSYMGDGGGGDAFRLIRGGRFKGFLLLKINLRNIWFTSMEYFEAGISPHAI